MWNTYDKCEFEHTFEELHADMIAMGAPNKTAVDRLKRIWDYFEEGKNSSEINTLMFNQDRRTKPGKWASTMKEKHGLSRGFTYEINYMHFVRREGALKQKLVVND